MFLIPCCIPTWEAHTYDHHFLTFILHDAPGGWSLLPWCRYQTGLPETFPMPSSVIGICLWGVVLTSTSRTCCLPFAVPDLLIVWQLWKPLHQLYICIGCCIQLKPFGIIIISYKLEDIVIHPVQTVL